MDKSRTALREICWRDVLRMRLFLEAVETAKPTNRSYLIVLTEVSTKVKITLVAFRGCKVSVRSHIGNSCTPPSHQKLEKE